MYVYKKGNNGYAMYLEVGEGVDLKKIKPESWRESASVTNSDILGSNFQFLRPCNTESIYKPIAVAPLTPLNDDQLWLMQMIQEWDHKSLFAVIDDANNYYFCVNTAHTPANYITKKQWLAHQENKPQPIVFDKPEHTGLSVGYYDVVIPANSHTNPEHNQPEPIVVSCNDIIEALKMNYACANVFKAIWRICTAKTGKMKKGNNTKYDAEKAVFFSERVLKQEQKS